jgi:hypothetical protein
VCFLLIAIGEHSLSRSEDTNGYIFGMLTTPWHGLPLLPVGKRAGRLLRTSTGPSSKRSRSRPIGGKLS